MSDIKYDIIATSSGEYKTTLNRTYRERKPWEPLDPNQIRSFMPGSVEQIDVAVGDKVKEGQRLLVFRAMKMSNNILSPVAGKVKSITVEPGFNIPKDHVMIEIKPAEKPKARSKAKPRPVAASESPVAEPADDNNAGKSLFE